VLGNLEAALDGDLVLALLDFLVIKLFDAAAIEANQMVVVGTGVELEDGLAGFKVVAIEQACLLELRQYAVHGSQTDVHILRQQDLVHILRGEVAHLAVLEDFQDFQSRQGRFQAAGFQVARIVTHVCYSYMGVVLYHIAF